MSLAILILILLLYSGIDATSRLKQLGMEFTVWVFKHVSGHDNFADCDLSHICSSFNFRREFVYNY